MTRKLSAIIVAITAAGALVSARPALGLAQPTQNCGVTKAAVWTSTAGAAGTPRIEFGVFIARPFPQASGESYAWDKSKLVGNTWTVTTSPATPCPDALAQIVAESPQATATGSSSDGTCNFNFNASIIAEPGFDHGLIVCPSTHTQGLPTIPPEHAAHCANIAAAKHGQFPFLVSHKWRERAYGTSCKQASTLTRHFSAFALRLARQFKVTHARVTVGAGTGTRWLCAIDATAHATCAKQVDVPGLAWVRVGPETTFAPVI
ncbi:MAG: hypothetical protein ACYC91_17185 [Solirubrobacteraceae bacterium]